MRETQLPRWEVFKQDNENKVHQAVGTVHAADADHALLTARNVFGRRPHAISMWVARANDIFSVTSQELERSPLKNANKKIEGDKQMFLLFSKQKHGQSMTFVNYVDALDAYSAQDAILQGMQKHGDALVWWAVPEVSITKSSADDVESWFTPAKDKTYKQQSAYGKVRAKVSS